MKLKEILEKHEVVTDSKARRRSNVSGKTANITAEEIESGVTIERLTALNVPVFQYSTQVTIHGTLPEFSETARPAGYKSVFRNANGTIGVKYVAIDAAKKQLLCSISRVREGKFNASLDSQGLTLNAYFSEKAECLEAYRNFPRDLFAGSVKAAAGFWGGYYVIAEVGAIPEANFWTLVDKLFNITEAEYTRLKTEKDEAQRIESERRTREYEENMAKRKAESDTAMEAIAASISLPRLNAIPTTVGSRFVTIHSGILEAPKAVLYVLTKKAFGKVLYAATTWDESKRDWQPVAGVKQHPIEKKMAALKARLAKGYMWEVK